MKLVSNECAACCRPLGYLAPGALQIPTFCVLCASDKETMKDWGHTIDKHEKPIFGVLRDYLFHLNSVNLNPVKGG
jgi:hypothetical protein